MWRPIFKYPMLAVGVLMLYLAISDAHKRGKLQFNRDRIIPSSCRAVLVMLDKRIPSRWETACEDQDFNYLTLSIPSEVKNVTEDKALNTALYRELANQLTFVSVNSPEENLMRVNIVKLELHHEKKTITAYAKGADVARLATLKDQELIMAHLKEKFQVREKSGK